MSIYPNNTKILVVGCGFAGVTYARLLAEKNYRVDIIDSRNHIAGNCYDFINELNQLESKYGPHIFHTNNYRVVDWLSNFTEWVDYKHKVKALHTDGNYYTLPVNKETKREIGEKNILEIFFKPYSEKMWGIKYSDIDPSVIKRVKIRDDYNEYYFPKDSFQKLPSKGYTHLFSNILDHKNISIQLSTKFYKELEKDYDFVFNSMPIDEYYDYVFGELPYRSIIFNREHIQQSSIHKTLTTNFTTYTGPTRVSDYSYLPYNEKKESTIAVFEHPCDYKDNNYERYYPVKDINKSNIAIYKKYKQIKNYKMQFIGRCGTYQYLDIDQVINQSILGARKFIKNNAI